MAKNTKRRTLLYKQEAVEGTAETLTVAEGVLLVRDVSVKYEPTMNDRRPMRPTLTPVSSVRGLAKASVSFTFELKGEDSTPASVPSWSGIMEAARFLEIIDGATSIAWKPSNALQPTVTLAVQIDGLQVKLRGARATALELDWPPGKFPEVTVTMSGILVGAAMTDTPLLFPEYSDVLPIAVYSSATLGGVALTHSEFKLSAEMESADRYQAGLEHGLKSVWNNRVRFTGSFNPELEAAATKDWLADMLADTTAELILKCGNGTAGREITLTAPRLQLTAMSDDAREVLAVAGLEFQLVGDPDSSSATPSSCGDELTIQKE